VHAVSEKKASGWRPPTRRTFVQMLAAAAAALALKQKSPETKPRPIWIGHH